MRIQKGTANQVIYRAAILYRQGSTCYYEGCIYGNQKMRVNIFVGIWILSMLQSRLKQKKTLQMATFSKLPSEVFSKNVISVHFRYRSSEHGTGQIWYKILSCGKNFYGVARSSPREQRSSALHLVFQICQHCFSKQKNDLSKQVVFLFGGTGQI